MIEIKITDPHLMDKETIRHTATFLLNIIGDEIARAPEVTKIDPFHELDNDVACGRKIKRIDPLHLTPEILNKVINSGNSELDSKGIPWDARIHSRTKSKTPEGAWKLMRGVTSDTVQKVEEELRRNVIEPPVVLRETSSTLTIPVAPNIPMPPVDPIGPLETPGIDFKSLMAKITNAVTSQKISFNDVLKLVQEHGIPNIPVLPTRPDLIPIINEELEKRFGVV